MSDGLICLLRVETKEVHREELGERWCFICRKRVPFVFTVRMPADPEKYHGFYGPEPSVYCEPRRHQDGDLFPGREREWE